MIYQVTCSTLNGPRDPDFTTRHEDDRLNLLFIQLELRYSYGQFEVKSHTANASCLIPAMILKPSTMPRMIKQPPSPQLWRMEHHDGGRGISYAQLARVKSAYLVAYMHQASSRRSRIRVYENEECIHAPDVLTSILQCAPSARAPRTLALLLL